MKVVKANIVNLWKNGYIVCVTTNGFVTTNHKGVMGRGNALAMSTLIPNLKEHLGKYLIQYGNNVGFIYDRVIAFPVKPDYCNWNDALEKYKRVNSKSLKKVPGFYCKADVNLIKRSVEQLSELIKQYNLKQVYLPIPGIGNGELSMKQVEDSLEFLPEEVIICSL